MGAELNKVVIGLMAGDAYGFPVARVESLIRVPEITPLPGQPAFMEGIMSLRGLVLPVIDLRKRLGLPAGYDDKTRVLVADIGVCAAGLVVDGVNEVIELPPSKIEPLPAGLPASARARLTGIGKAGDRLVLMLDLAKLLAPDEQSAVSAALDKK